MGLVFTFARMCWLAGWGRAYAQRVAEGTREKLFPRLALLPPHAKGGCSFTMSDPISHECGIAVVRLKKPLGYFYQKYGNTLYGFDALQAIMTKQRNRGQDGMGIGCSKLGMPPGLPYMFRMRSTESVERIGQVFEDERKEFKRIARRIDKQRKDERDQEGKEFVSFEDDPDAIKREFEMAGGDLHRPPALRHQW